MTRGPADASLCVKCSGPVPQATTGRPRRYCSVACRRAIEFELRRIERRLERLEDEAASLDRDAMSVPKGWGAKYHNKATVARKQIAEMEARLRALLAATEREADD